jgi:ankyrin repeat protein
MSSKINATMILKQNNDNCTPIHNAVEEGHKEIVQQFIDVAFTDRQEMFTIKNKDGRTPLHLAALKGFLF